MGVCTPGSQLTRDVNCWRRMAASHQYRWQKLTILYGGAAGDSAAIRRKAYFTLLFSDTAGFNALLGGGRDLDGRYSRRNAHGFYWAATENDSSTAWFCNFANGSHAIYQQQEGEKTRAFSVRCVKNIDGLKR